ncbi:CoB--CoM heterodisulfide reductase iron-sulfur subunit A family protein [Candidatus Bathyarchaeota archaeon]|nr:CoB--CoM heterodisulfide reductase iron-sulfur subunit A family protein [Candidatus Bathyarchaeota archaeon]
MAESNNEERLNASKSGEIPRIGVYVCHCGTNIAGSVDVKKIVEYASTLPNVVVAKDYRYLCSDPGQAIIKQDVKEFKLNRVVIAACTPTLHELTFSKCVEEVGLNRYLLTIANIREQCSWVHMHRIDEATEKAIEIVRMAVARASLLEPLKVRKVPIRKSCLIIGGGISGIQAALDLAGEGFDVYLVEKNPSIGGHMARFDKTFPTMDCSLCILSPKMADVGHNPKIELLTNSEVIDIKGYVGNFKATILKKPRYVTKDCSACGECSKVCPETAPNEFDEGLSTRHAIYIPFPQAVPSTYVIDRELCLNKEAIVCDKCMKACERKAIDFTMKPETVELEVGTIIVATGHETFDPSELEEYGYKKYANVVTGPEFERILSPTGPTEGKVVRPSDKKVPKRVAFIQCVGSRDEKTNPYCSRVCCMYATKQALLIKEKIPDAEVLIFYIDMRAFGKGYEEFYKRAQKEGIRYIRGRVAEISEDAKSKNLTVRAEDTLLGVAVEAEVDLVILSVGLVPRIETSMLSTILNLSKGSDGFLREAHPKLRPVDSLVDGVFLAGTVQGPKDIPDSVAQASAAAQKASILMSVGEAEVEAISAEINSDLCSRCLICLHICPFNALIYSEGKVEVLEALCKGCGACAAACPSKAIKMKNFTNEQILAELKGVLLGLSTGV